MAKVLLTEEQFSRIVVTRARRERPDIRVKPMGKFFLMVEPEPGRQRVVSLVNLYQIYCDCPTDRDEVIGNFLANSVYAENEVVRGTFEENRHKIMPQVVPPSLLDFCRQEGRELAALGYTNELYIAFVVDEPERYSYLQRSVAERWGVGDTELLMAAVQNLQKLNQAGAEFYTLGSGARITLVWETFDGYDASRVLLSRDLNEMAALVPGNPVIGVPHRDYMVMFGDADPEFVAEMSERIRVHFESHSYPITARLLTLVEGNLESYPGAGRRLRVLN